MFGLHEKSHPGEAWSRLHEQRILLKRDIFYSYNTKTGCFDIFTIIRTNPYKQTLNFLETCSEHVIPKKNDTGNKDVK